MTRPILIALALCACTPAQLQSFDAKIARVEAECVAARDDYAAIAAGRDQACGIIALLPEELGGKSTAPAKAACAASKRVEQAGERVVRVCSAIAALGAQ